MIETKTINFTPRIEVAAKGAWMRVINGAYVALTDWYPPEIKPFRVGMYESQIFDAGFVYDWFVHWDGRHWRDGTGMTLIDQNLTWRGILEEME